MNKYIFPLFILFLLSANIFNVFAIEAVYFEDLTLEEKNDYSQKIISSYIKNYNVSNNNVSNNNVSNNNVSNNNVSNIEKNIDKINVNFIPYNANLQNNGMECMIKFYDNCKLDDRCTIISSSGYLDSFLLTHCVFIVKCLNQYCQYVTNTLDIHWKNIPEATVCKDGTPGLISCIPGYKKCDCKMMQLTNIINTKNNKINDILLFFKNFFN